MKDTYSYLKLDFIMDASSKLPALSIIGSTWRIAFTCIVYTNKHSRLRLWSTSYSIQWHDTNSLDWKREAYVPKLIRDEKHELWKQDQQATGSLSVNGRANSHQDLQSKTTKNGWCKSISEYSNYDSPMNNYKLKYHHSYRNHRWT